MSEIENKKTLLSYEDFEAFVNIPLPKEKRLYSNNKHFMLWQFVQLACHRQGDIAEVGVWRGGTAAIILNAVRGRKKVFLFDTFEGIPSVCDKDEHHKGDFSETSLEEVKSFLQLDYTKFSLIKGVFPDSAKTREDLKEFAFVHIDVDVYQSTKDCIHFFYELLAQGGIMFFDDYGVSSCRGAKLAIDEFCQQNQEHVLYFETGQAAIIKR